LRHQAPGCDGYRQGAARNALVAQMQALLTGAEFGGKPISAKTGKSLISQGNALLAQAVTLAHG